jgi:hypothetical protein
VLAAIDKRTYTLTPREAMKPGEYLICFRGSNGIGGYGFSVR